MTDLAEVFVVIEVMKEATLEEVVEGKEEVTEVIEVTEAGISGTGKEKETETDPQGMIVIETAMARETLVDRMTVEQSAEEIKLRTVTV